MKDNIPQDLLIVVGARHYSANIKFLISTDDKNSLKCDGTATIFHEKDNQFDKNAIAVEVDNRIVGYISKFRSAQLLKLIGDRKVELNCTLLWNGDPEEDYCMYTVQLFV